MSLRRHILAIGRGERDAILPFVREARRSGRIDVVFERADALPELRAALLGALVDEADARLADRVFEIAQQLPVWDAADAPWRLEASVLHPVSGWRLSLRALLDGVDARAVGAFSPLLNDDAALCFVAPESPPTDDADLARVAGSLLPALGGSLAIYSHQLRSAADRLSRGRLALVIQPLLGAEVDHATVLVGERRVVRAVGVSGDFVRFDRSVDLEELLVCLHIDGLLSDFADDWLAPIATGRLRQVEASDGRWCRRHGEVCRFPKSWLCAALRREADRIDAAYTLWQQRAEVAFHFGE